MDLRPAGRGRAADRGVPPYFIANSSITLREALLAASGIALIPTFVVGPDVRAGRLRTVLPELEVPPQTMYALYPSTRHLSPKVRSLVDFLIERYGDEPS